MRLDAGQRAGTVGPLGEEVAQRPDDLRRPRRAREVLTCPAGLDARRAAAVRGDEVGSPLLLGAVDLLGPGGEGGQDRVVDALDFEGRIAALAARPVGPAHGHAMGEFVGEEGVVERRDRDRCGVDGRAVEGAPDAVGALDLVGEHDVRVQVRVAVSGVPVVERGGDDAARADLAAAGVADAGAGDCALDEVEGLVDGGPVGGVDAGARAVVAERPEDRGGLGDGEGEVVADDGPVGAVAVGAAEGRAGQWVVAVAEDGGHGGFGDRGARVEVARCVVAEAGEPAAEPATGRVAGGLVVGDERVSMAQAGVASGDVPGEVCVAVAGHELVHRHHREPPPFHRRPRHREVCGGGEKTDRPCRSRVGSCSRRSACSEAIAEPMTGRRRRW